MHILYFIFLFFAQIAFSLEDIPYPYMDKNNKSNYYVDHPQGYYPDDRYVPFFEDKNNEFNYYLNYPQGYYRDDRYVPFFIENNIPQKNQEHFVNYEDDEHEINLQMKNSNNEEIDQNNYQNDNEPLLNQSLEEYSNVRKNNQPEKTIKKKKSDKEFPWIDKNNQPKKTIKKRKSQWSKMTSDLFDKMLEYEKKNPDLKQLQLEKIFNINRTTYWRWKKNWEQKKDEIKKNKKKELREKIGIN